MNIMSTTENNSTEALESTPQPESTQPGHQRQRRGKIARLPRALRQELNLRLQDGEPGKPLAQWLNGLPEVQAVMTALFHGTPIREQNISEWRKGGYQDWERAEEARLALAGVEEDMEGMKETSKEGLTHRLAFYLAAQLALQIQRVSALPDGAEKVKSLRELTASLVALRRGDLQEERLLLEREKQGLAKKSKEEREADFWKWAEENVNRDEFCRRRCFTEEEREAAIDKILGITPEQRDHIAKVQAAAAAAEAGVDPAPTDSLRVNPT
jgi:hypothetical protein